LSGNEEGTSMELFIFVMIPVSLTCIC